MDKRLGAVSVDVDTLQDYANIYGLKAFGNQIYERAVGRLIELFEIYKVRATFFIIARDALNPVNKKIIREITNQGHEIASHSMNHNHAFSDLPRRIKYSEIIESKKALEDVTGREVWGFRAPSLDMDKEGIDILCEGNYRYDSSFAPTIFMKIFKFFGGVKAGKHIPGFGGRIHNCFASSKPHFLCGTSLMEFPIGIAPYVYAPLYGTALLMTGEMGFNMVYRLAASRNYLHYLIHASEMIDAKNDNIDSAFLVQPGFRIPLARKKAFYGNVLKKVAASHTVGPLKDMLEEFAAA